MEKADKVPEAKRQGALDMLRFLAGGVGGDSTLAKQLAAVNKSEDEEPGQSYNTIGTAHRNYMAQSKISTAGRGLNPQSKIPATGRGAKSQSMNSATNRNFTSQSKSSITSRNLTAPIAIPATGRSTKPPSASSATSRSTNPQSASLATSRSTNPQGVSLAGSRSTNSQSKSLANSNNLNPRSNSAATHKNNSSGIQVIPAQEMPPVPTGPTVPEAGAVHKNPFHVDTTQLRAVPMSQQDSEIQNLGLTVYNQQEFEDGIMNQVDQAMAEQEKERVERILEKSMKSVQEDIRTIKQELLHMNKVLISLSPNVVVQNKEAQNKLEAIKKQQENKQKQLKKLKAKEKSLRNKLHGVTENPDDCEEIDSLGEALGLTTKNETETERLIRLGEMTPFGTVMSKTASEGAQANQMSDFEKYLRDQNEKTARKKTTHKKKPSAALGKSKSAQDLEEDDEPITKKLKVGKSRNNADDDKSKEKQLTNRFDEKDKRKYAPSEKDFSNYKQRKRHFKLAHEWSGDPDLDLSDCSGGEEGFNPDDDEWRPDNYLDEEEDAPYGTAGIPGTKRQKKKSNKGAKSSKQVKFSANNDDSNSSDEFDVGKIKGEFGVKQPKATGGTSGGGAQRAKDDGDVNAYKRRLDKYKKDKLRKKQLRIMKQNDPDAELSDDETDSDDEQDMEFDGGFKVPGKIWKKLYRYQKTGVKWLWELHLQQAGGIVGDEMGLGKTIQTVTFLSGLRYSKLRDKGANTRYQGLGPTLIVCPATVMHQWVCEFHKWAPLFRVGVLHSSGSYGTSPERLIRSIAISHGVLITSFSTMVIHQDTLLEHDWHYVILDEGHKIRNPDAQVTLAAKQFRTCHRIILSGSPVQNNLKELWSLFDFVFPGKLGTLPDFMSHFSVPIVQGGYSNATEVQVQTAYKCACVLRDTINPYLLRRMKADVQINLQLPNKNEQVLFCRLTDEQKDVYQEYLDSKECHMILSGKFMVFPGLITLRKICNHPDISTGGPSQFDPSFHPDLDECKYGYFRRSGKMIVVESLLKLWQTQGHRVLLFTQSKQMLDILEMFVKAQNYKFMRMDGGTTIASRQPLINKFNNDESYFVFLLTTRVGGLGVNLTGANRIIIFDPDWNPSTDLQARERAWRIGQKKQVTIYRLLTTGTIEEKIYHRQIFKQFLTNRVLKDPKQRRFFKSNDLFELFTLGDDDKKTSTETSAIFAGTGSDVKVKKRRSGPHAAEDDTEFVPRKRNRFDEMREREIKEESDPKEDKKSKKVEKAKKDKEPEEEDDDGDCGFSAAKIKEMKELARKLARQFTGGQNKEKEESDQIDTTIAATTSSSKTSSDDSNDGSKEEASQPVTETTEKVTETKETKKKEKHKKKKDKHKEKSKKKKKKRKAKDAIIDGEKIDYLDRHEVKKIEEDLEQEAESSQQDDFVLQSLFKKSGVVHSAMQHDKIMMSSDPDYALVEGEADRVAKEAAKALKESRARCFGARTGVPTWTGTSGAGGAPPKPRFGQKKNAKLVNPDDSKTTESPSKKTPEKKKEIPVQPTLFDGSVAGNLRTNAASASAATPNVMSSTQLLSRMRARNHLALAEPVSDEEEDLRNPHRRNTSGMDPDDLELITDIRNYVAYQAHMDGRASTQELLEEFKQRIPANESAKFKAMLKQVCDYDKLSGIGMWFLKPEYK